MYPSMYILDVETIKLYAYRLLCLFYANKEISRLSDPDSRDDSSSKLERTFFSREMTHLLLNIAVGIRVLDDQIKALPIDDSRRQSYITARDQINDRYHCMMFDDEISLREVCNKIIHATTVEPHTQDGAESHRIDGINWIAWSGINEDSPNEAGREPIPIAMATSIWSCSSRWS